ncbi:hypothetical protein ESY86_15775 [Subsaximicrobium wynnwilliamsii]|uniref:Uncharacterized protein n=1 Tax=Subsaximicrobium wynnwilliamsii TaxID=291179 RepID=A0A5C6ZDH1_9FLAO|nr:hypothetical protein [Subsaximicrobium wynnwilliamsii]TXD82124.1 hypothetical protein ESY87_15365 [Subsaximicrobium wynnwilliamsii]TXD87769.1 hypothetical protein ESY86_15775 [Subsaximicrobium wynnwilliamsii]TXE01580.1 hypothetical protein ESY88_15355 [Subsaximicrobium wynnwilliamsii]
MIAVTDTSAFAALEIVQPQVQSLIPSENEIETLIGANTFVNATITTAFKNLLKRISLESINPTLGFALQPDLILVKVSQMFNRIGFYYDANSMLSFSTNDNALSAGTEMIIDELNDFTTFQEIAYYAFHNNGWAQNANNIRAMENSGLQKLHYITVFSDSNANSTYNYTPNLNNQINILNLRNENTQRFLLIGFDNATDANPKMPNVRISNNSDVQLKLRVKVEYNKYVTSPQNRLGGFGPAIPYDLNNNGTIATNERIYFNRRFLDYFPNETNATDIEGDIFTRVLQPQSFWDIDCDDRVRGGEVTIDFFPEPENINFWRDGNHHYFKFHIRGKNPTYLQVENYLTNQNYLGRFWFMVRKIRQESGSLGTNDNSEFEQFNALGNYAYSTRKTTFRGLPNFGVPRGYGLSQLDNFGGPLTDTQINNLGLTNELAEIQNGAEREFLTIIDEQNRVIDSTKWIVASDQQVWHWKENIDKAVNFLETEKMTITINEITRIRDRVIAWNNANPTDLVVVPTPEYYNTIIYCWTASAITEFVPYNNLFNQGTAPTIVDQGERELKSFFDAMLLKTYNGIPNQEHFMDINNASSNELVKPVLTIYNTTNPNPFYVRSLSNRDD